MARFYVHALVLMTGLALVFTGGVASADVVVLNSMGEPDSNRAGENLPEWIEGGTGTVNTGDTAGLESSASLQFVASGGWEIFNDHYLRSHRCVVLR